MSKFEIGDFVVTKEFKDQDHPLLGWYSCMKDYVGAKGVISKYDPEDSTYEIHGYWWPESSLESKEDTEVSVSHSGIFNDHTSYFASIFCSVYSSTMSQGNLPVEANQAAVAAVESFKKLIGE